ncbi:hypothetical protein SISSUDRAFT_1063591 [Sistotremastrum suecicum HHB10207 ss-3]|nr:hypothetical protein SISSUDRAFT_1063591 [Sistotremastrum suecicum HHB10207 ss-3]
MSDWSSPPTPPGTPPPPYSLHSTSVELPTLSQIGTRSGYAPRAPSECSSSSFSSSSSSSSRSFSYNRHTRSVSHSIPRQITPCPAAPSLRTVDLPTTTPTPTSPRFVHHSRAQSAPEYWNLHSSSNVNPVIFDQCVQSLNTAVLSCSALPHWRPDLANETQNLQTAFSSLLAAMQTVSALQSPEMWQRASRPLVSLHR